MGEAAEIQLQIVLPCFNPRPGWEDRILQSWTLVRNELPQLNLGLVLVNDGSTRGVDETALLKIRNGIPGMHYIACEKNMGKGFALRKGVEVCTAPLIIYTDVDFPYQESSLVQMYRELASGNADVVAGVRDESYYAKVPAGRKRISKLLRWMLRTFLRLKITDTQCGLKGFNRRGREIFLSTRINRFLFDLEFIYLSGSAKDSRLVASPVVLKPGIEFTKVSWKILLGESWNFFKIFVRGIFGRKR